MSSKIVAITPDQTLKAGLTAIEQSAIGIALLVDSDGRFLRTVTDGDIRRLLLTGEPMDRLLSTLANITSITTRSVDNPKQALAILNEHKIEHLPVLDDMNRPVSIILRRDIPDRILLSTPHLGKEELSFVNEAFSTNWIAPLGPNVDAFESELAQNVQTKAACALSSGTAAIHLGLKLLNVAAGDYVFVSDLTFVASVNPILYQGAIPVFIDSEPTSWNMSPAALKRAMSEAEKFGKLPKAVIVVNLYGQSADIDPLLAICDAYDVPLFEDAAESLGAKYKGKPSGTLGVMGCYSFNGNKIITTSAGGMLVSKNADLMARARYLASQARMPEPHYEHTEVGYNYRMSNILAGVGRGQLRVLADRVARRREINETYRVALRDVLEISWMPEPEWSFSNRWLSCFTIVDPSGQKTAMGLIRWLDNHMVEARNIWKPMHMQPVFEDIQMFSHTGGNKMLSADIFENGLCLPSGSNMTENMIAEVAEHVRAYFDQS